MVKRLKDTFIRDNGERRFSVWIDVLQKDIEEIKGIEYVVEISDSHYDVTCDPRYDLEEIKAEIIKLVEPDANLC